MVQAVAGNNIHPEGLFCRQCLQNSPFFIYILLMVKNRTIVISLGSVVSEFNETTSRPNYYESIAPETRFVRIANAILEKSGEVTGQNPNNKMAVWPNKPEGHFYQAQVVVSFSVWGQPTFIFSLEHHIHELPDNRPLVRYVVTNEGGKNSPISVYDAMGKKKNLNKKEQELAVWHALDILSQAMPKESQEILESIVDYRFESLVGAYILSRFAVEGSTETMDELSALVAADEHVAHIQSIEANVLANSKQNDSPAKQETITEAVTTRRTKTNKNNYKPIDVIVVTDRAFKLIGPKWRYSVTEDQ